MKKEDEIMVIRKDGTVITTISEKKKRKQPAWTPERAEARRQRNGKRPLLHHVCRNCEYHRWEKAKLPHATKAWKYLGVPKDCPACGGKDTFEPENAVKDH